ncbi:MAG: hypothetical protein LBG22_06225 [Treponema sp.]|nr:hypothetical protein [Treponema sp.]
MESKFKILTREIFNNLIAEYLCPKIEAILKNRSPGHCIRVIDLDEQIIINLCKKISKSYLRENIFMLKEPDAIKFPYEISSTKLIELRNPGINGELKPPLLVFIPPALRTSAEDSFGIATFEELAFPDIYRELIEVLFERIPPILAGGVREIFKILSEQAWKFADEVAYAKYLLTAIENGVDGETLGAALYELSLIPDFKLFVEINLIRSKIFRNIESIGKLVLSYKSVRGRINDLELSDSELETRLFAFFEKYDMAEPRKWTQNIILDSIWWGLSFDKWTFQKELILDKILVTVLETDLPIIQEDERDVQLASLIGQQVLVPSTRRKMNVSFMAEPHPSKVSGLDHFTVQIISKNEGTVGKAKKVKAWSVNRSQSTVSIYNLNKIDFEEGWHCIRIIPWTIDDDPIPMGIDAEAAKPSNESEFFYVLPDANIQEEPPQRAIPRVWSLEHARFRLQLTALQEGRGIDGIVVNSVAWVEDKSSRKNSRQTALIVRFEREGVFQIPLSNNLKAIEQKILFNPKHPSGYSLRINSNSDNSITETGLSIISSSAYNSFLAARETFFNSIRQNQSCVIMQGLSFAHTENECLMYAEAYLNLIKSILHIAETSEGMEKQQYLETLRNITAVDSIHIILTDYRGKSREAMLIAPTHPLRTLWFLGWSALGRDWINVLKEGGRDYIPHIREVLLERLEPSSFPAGIPAPDGRIFIPVDNINPYWALYTPTSEENARGLLSELCSAFGITAPLETGSDISGIIIGEKIEKYLLQHPYVRELSMNIFNPGSGKIFTDALLYLQGKREYIDLRYDIRLFSLDPDSPVLGESFDNLINPESVISASADAFSTSTGNFLFSKLKLAKHSIFDYNNTDNNWAAHISVLLDMFPAKEISIMEKLPEITPFYGLIQDFNTDFTDADDKGAFWDKYPIVGKQSNNANPTGCFDLIADLNSHINYAISAVASSGAQFKALPVITLGLDAEDRKLISEIHRLTDWVFTIDKNMGIEFFDHGGKKKRPEYLIDYIPGVSSLGTHNLIISSQSSSELKAMINPILKEQGLPTGDEHAPFILSALRSLSGQLALKLISTSNQQKEALGLALARLYLEYQGSLKNQIILPLDAHTDLYKGSSDKDDIIDTVSLQRTDLALFDLNLTERTITCCLIEVKCYSDVGNPGAYNQLKEHIADQISMSERIIQRHFDPSLKIPDRPDRLLKSRELSQILRFYLDRSIRYGIFDQDAAREAKGFLKSIEEGYSLQFRRSALIFDFAKDGPEDSEMEVGIEYHRLGKNLINALLEGCKMSTSSDVLGEAGSVSLSEQYIPELPKLATASFVTPNRERSTSAVKEIKQNDEAVSDAEIYLTDISDIGDPKPLINESPKDTQEVYETKSHEEESFSQQVKYDIMLGVKIDSPQFGILGEMSGRKVALDLNQTHTISLFGVQGGGKSYTLGTIIEMASMQIPNINELPSPLATVIFHYSPTQDYAPEFTSMVNPNTVTEEMRMLLEQYHGKPMPFKDILLLSPENKVIERKKEFPGIEVRPLAFAASELKAPHWKFLMGAVGNQSMYLRQINMIMRALRDNLTLDSLRAGIEKSGMQDHLKTSALNRLQFAEEYINDTERLQDLIHPGRLIIVDLRDELIEKDEALGLFVVLLQILSEAVYEEKSFNKLVVFDEAHKYIENADLIAGLVEVVREMRHKGTSIMVASQDPPSVPVSLIELSTQIIMHKFNSPAWLKHIQKANTALSSLTSEKMSRLGTGEAYIWSSQATDDLFTRGAVKIKCRPRVTQHGGSTKTAIGR